MRTRDEGTAAPPIPVRAEPVGCEAQPQAEPRLAPRLPIAASLLLAALASCVTVEAPDKPIVIELNVNIRQEVIYRLAADAKNTVEENENIF